MLELVIVGAFFCYGIFTLQRRGFLWDKLPILWKKFPKMFHEPLFSCGVCVTSIWGILFVVSQYLISRYAPPERAMIYNIPFYIIAMCGICALVDRAVKYFEYGYKYTSIPPDADYSYLSNYDFRNNLIKSFLLSVTENSLPIVEIGGVTPGLKSYSYYYSFDKQANNKDALLFQPAPVFILIKGLAFEGNFDHLLNILQASKGFIIEGSLAGESGKQLQWIMDRFKFVIKMPYSIDDAVECRPDHCGSTNNRIILVKPVFTV